MTKFYAILKHLKFFLTVSSHHFIKNDCLNRAQALAFTTLLSLVPLLTVFFGILTIFPIFKNFSANMENFIFSHFMPGTGIQVQSYFHSFINNALGLSLAGLFFLLFTAIALIFTIESTFDLIWKIKVQRPFLSAVVMYSAALTFLPLLMGISFAVTSYMTSLSLVTFISKFLIIKKICLILLSYLLSFISFLLLYTLIPHCKIDIFAAAGGAFLAAFLFETLKNSFAWYLKYFTSYELLYGTLGAIPAFLFWLYLSWFIILLGGVFTYVFQHYKTL